MCCQVEEAGLVEDQEDELELPHRSYLMPSQRWDHNLSMWDQTQILTQVKKTDLTSVWKILNRKSKQHLLSYSSVT